MKLDRWLFTLAIMALIIAAIVGHHHDAAKTQEPTPAQAHTEFKAPVRPCYIDSVVECGVWTADAAGVPTGHSISAPRDETYYTSYRIGDKIYWTDKPVHIHKGELLWTDGKRLIRARCGNELSRHRPLPPTGLHADVTEEILDKTIVPPSPEYPPTTFVTSLSPPALPPTFDPQPPTGFPPLPPLTPCCSTVFVKAPEGSTVVMLFLGILAIVVGIAVKQNRRKP